MLPSLTPLQKLWAPFSRPCQREREISRTFTNKFQKKLLCKYLHQGELLPNAQASPWDRAQECPAMDSTAATAQALEKASPRDVPAGNQAPAVHLCLLIFLVFADLPCYNCSGQTGFGTFPMMLCASKFHWLIRHCTEAFPSGCLGFLWLSPPSLRPRRN